jgi:Carbohydrate family 9 binding domain-like
MRPYTTSIIQRLLNKQDSAKVIILFIAAYLILNDGQAQTDVTLKSPLLIKMCNDFAITGNGKDPEWSKTDWNLLTQLDGDKPFETKFKILYSSTGLYVFFQGEDDKITTKDYKDFESIFNGDVYEVFFHTNPDVKVYFEYEVNHLGKELILAISNLPGQNYNSWVPRNPGGKNRSGIQKAVEVVGGKPEINGNIKSWSAEIFFPFGTLGLFQNVPPKSGTLWNANFCRLDYDGGAMIKWSWTPTIKKSFHELDQFRSIKFE